MSAKMFDGAVTKDSESSDTGNPFDFDDDEDEEDKDKTPASGAPSVSPFAAAATTPVAQNADKSPDTNDAPSRMNFSIRNVMNMFVRSGKPNNPATGDASKKVRSKIWHSVVNITVIEARDLLPKPDHTLPDPFVKFKLGTERYKSKTKPKTLAPRWLEQFDLYMFEDQPTVVEISVRDCEIGGRENVLGRCDVDLDKLEREKTHRMEQPLDDNNGTVVLLVTVCNTTPPDPSSSSPSSPSSPTSDGNIAQDCHEQQQQQQLEALSDAGLRNAMIKKYGWLGTFKDIGDVGWLRVKVIRAHGLSAADMGGTSDPFCVLELVNSRIQTPTCYKTLNPEWNKTCIFAVNDVHAVLDVSVLDENRSRKVDFLGRVGIPLLRMKLGERQWHQLKDAKLLNRKKGVIQLELDFVYNPIKAAIRTFNPKEPKYMQPEPKFKVGTMKKNIDRVSKIVQGIVDTAKFVQSCLDWDSKPKSISAFIIFVVVVLYCQLFMLPGLMVLIFLKNLMVLNIVESFKDSTNEEIVEVEGDDDDDLDPKGEKKGFVEKFQAIQEVCLIVQEKMDMVATLAERASNALTWKVPWLSCLALIVLTAATLLTYFIPLRYLILVWGINKFSKKLRNPNYVDNNELLDYLSRVPSDKQLIYYREFRPDPIVQAALRKKQQ